MQDYDYETLVERKKFLEQEIMKIDEKQINERSNTLDNVSTYVFLTYLLLDIPLILILMCLCAQHFLKHDMFISLMSLISFILSFVIIRPICNYITEVIVTYKCTIDKGVYADYFRIKGEIERVNSEIVKIEKGVVS